MKQMKKYLAFVIVIFTVILSSCTNDDIPVDRSVTFKLNPSTVVEGLYEMNAGDLTSLTSGAKASLIVDLYVYDEIGKLVGRDTQEFNSYTHVMTSNLSLGGGKYTVIATTHVTSATKYWAFEGISEINTFKIVDQGYIGGKLKILGLTVIPIEVNASHNTFNIDIENAGAVACVVMSNWNQQGNYKYFGLLGKQSCDYITTNIFGDVEYSIESMSNFNFNLVKFGYTPAVSSAMEYFFSFPIKNASMRFFAARETGNPILLGNNIVVNIQRGSSYLFAYDVATGVTISQDKTLSRSSCGDENLIVYDYGSKSISIR